MTRRELAEENFTSGYNCAQSVALAFADIVNIDNSELCALSSAFGGGMGRLREVCGAVSGMFMIAGLLYGCDSLEATAAKGELYARIQQLAKSFESENGSIVCRELLGTGSGHSSPTPESRTPEYYKKRPCRELVGCAAEILESYIRDNPPVR